MGEHGVLDVLTRPRALIHEARWEEARALVRSVAPLARSYYFECRLGHCPSERLDVLVGLGRGKQQALIDWLAQCDAPVDALRRACALWNAGPELVREAISGLWLEFDQVRGAPSLPSLCVCLVANYEDGVAPFAPQTIGASAAIARSVAEALQGEPLSSTALADLSRCLRALPAGGRVIHLSVMFSRPGRPIKLYCVLPRAGLVPFLERAGWRGPFDEITQLVAELCPVSRVAGELYVDLTLLGIDAPGGNILGIAFAPQHLVRSDERDPGRRPLLAACVARGLCTEAQRADLKEWPGRRLQARAESAGRVLVDRWLDLKLVWTPDAPLALKAYLGASWRSATTFDVAGLSSGV
jgi:hypothetical protein